MVFLLAWLVWFLLDELTAMTPGSANWMTVFGAIIGIAVWEFLIKPAVRMLTRGVRL